MLFRLGARQRTCEKQFLTLEFCGKFANFLAKSFLFLFWRSPAFCGKFGKILSENLFFKHFRVVSLVLGLGFEHSCPWPRKGFSSEGVSLALVFASKFFVFLAMPQALCPRLHLW